MNQFTFKPVLLATLLTLTVSGCDSIPFVDTSSDYKAAGRSRPLEVPPDLTNISASDAYAVPGAATNYSDYSQGLNESGQQENEQGKLLPTPDGVKMERAGSQRWLVVNAPPEKVWPVIREFWAELGFAVRTENAQTGVMETEWVDPSSLQSDDKSYVEKFQGWLDKLNSLQTRQKFRTRIDRGQDTGTTEIYMSHRAVSNAPDDGKVKVRTIAGEVEMGYAPTKSTRNKGDDTKSTAEDIDAELLRRLMVRLGVEDKKSRSIIATPTTELRANVNKEQDGTLSLNTNDAFDRAWRRVGLALDRVGFVVEDRDRSNGLFFVRYTDIDIDDAPKEKKGLLETLKFWGDDKDEGDEKSGKKRKPGENQYHVKVENASSGGSVVTVTDKDGNREHSSTANRIITLLYEQLK
ncbi:outer membrane protein assembly factor BamC [Methylobacillus gramineus]|uniref:outer membrane protein assembly factor BamC n=1 Tax=Methylobacillus gramineus TaxID=755169 RepID=UPI001CFFF7CA|nr:outer membrane protein assembly factor BamC [Methylobacillus gramineus]MCB5184825.1 outer membrane protein assembly factor BamC [Methylobacillus gramineus]